MHLVVIYFVNQICMKSFIYSLICSPCVNVCLEKKLGSVTITDLQYIHLKNEV